MTPELLSSIAGILLSLVFSYVPGVKDWFEQLVPDYKRLVMLGLLVLVAAAIFGLSCAGYLGFVTCDQAGVVKLLQILIAALIANQAAFLITPKAKG